MSDLWSDLKLAVRLLKRAPAFSAAVIIALALGIGPNTAIFSIVYATLLAPLPFPDPDQLVMVWSQVRGNRDGTSPAEYLDWKRQAGDIVPVSGTVIPRLRTIFMRPQEHGMQLPSFSCFADT